MPISNNLLPGQYQIGAKVFGKYTPIKVENFDAQAYNVVAQDTTINRSDRIVFGSDTFAPQPITLNMNVLDNRILSGMEAWTGISLPASFDVQGQRHVDELAAEWRADEVRTQWNAQKPLYICGRDGVVRMLYGRPRKFHSSKRSEKSSAWKITAEYMPVDTLFYSEEEFSKVVLPNVAASSVSRFDGSLSSPARIVITGPIVNPVVTFTGVVGLPPIELTYTIDPGEKVEISSYPWSERVINNLGYNLAPELNIGESPLLDQIRFAANRVATIGLTGTGTTGATNATLYWRNVWGVIL